MPDMLETILDRNLLGSLIDVTMLYNKCPDYDSSVTPNVDVMLSLDDLVENDVKIDGHTKTIATYYKEFLTAVLGDDYASHSVCNNLILARFKNEVLDFVTRPKICIVDGQITMILGADNRDQDVEAIKIPLAFTEKGITFSSPKTKVNRLAISSIEIQKSDGTKVKLPIVCFSYNKTVYAINVTMASDVTFYDLQSAWDDADQEQLSTLIAPPYGASANISSIFTNLFSSGAFPADGIIIPLTGFTKTQKPSKNGGKFWVVDYQVDLSGFPPINVTAYYDGATDEVPINVVTRLTTFQDAREPIGSKPFTDKAVQNPPTPANPWYLHVKGKNPSKKCPSHVIFESTLGAKQKQILDKQKSISYFPMPTAK